MIITRFELNGVHYGDLQPGGILPLTGPLEALHPSGDPLIDPASVRILAPVAPTKIVAIGPGYHASMKGAPCPPRPYLWIKPSTALLDPDGFIDIPPDVPMVCHESELAVVVGRRAKNVSIKDARSHILGYSCINDVSAGLMTDIQSFIGSQYFVDGKIFDTFAPIGPVIVTDFNPANVRIQCRINGEIRQDHSTSDRIWSPEELVSHISKVMTLNPGDVIATGSPPGPGPILPGDVIEIEIDGIGILRNTARLLAG